MAVAGIVNAAERADSVMHRLGEVSVTAFKAGSNLSTAPVALTTINGEEARRLGILSMKDVSALAPNFYIPEYGSRMTSSIYMRGLGARIDQPAVGLNVDNVPVLNKDAFDFDITDIERIEVLRGPQSTMYGRNTMAGLVNITTLSPLRECGARMMLETGSGTTLRAAASSFGKITSSTGMSLSAQYGYFGGFITNQHSGEKADRSRDLSLRWKTESRLSPTLRLMNAASISHGRQYGYPYALESTGQVNYGDTCFYRRTTAADGLTLTWNAPGFTLVSISSYQYIDDNMTLDQDFLTDEYFTLSQIRREHAVTEEIVMRGRSGNYRWLAGVFGFYKRSSMSAPVTFKRVGISSMIEDHVNRYNPTYPICWDDDAFTLGSDFVCPTSGAAIYHQSSVEAGNWNFSAGLRFDYERASLRYHSHTSSSYTTYNLSNPASPEIFSHNPVVIDDHGRLHNSFIELLPSVGVTWTSGDFEVYGSFGKGYKAGGFNTQMFSDVLRQRIMSMMGVSEKYDVDRIVSYKPEKSLNYEAGVKYDNQAIGLHASAALFYIDCRDQQLTTFPDGTTTGRIMTNAGRTRSYGLELSARYQPSVHWIFNTAYGYTNARFRHFNDGISDYSGCYVPYAPSNTLYLSGRYIYPIRDSFLRSISLDVNLRGIGRIWWDETNTSCQPFYAQLGSILSLNADKGSLEISGENLTSTKFVTFRYVSIENHFFQKGNPASVKVTLRIFI